MNMVEIPLTADNQVFSVSINGTSYRMRATWRGTFWCLDLMDSKGVELVSGMPLITGADLLAQYPGLGLGFSLIVLCDVPGQENPTEFDLGIFSHLYIMTE